MADGRNNRHADSEATVDSSRGGRKKTGWTGWTGWTRRESRDVPSEAVAMRADAAVEADEAGGDWESGLMLLPWAASASRLADVSTPDAADGHDGTTATRQRDYSGARALHVWGRAPRWQASRSRDAQSVGGGGCPVGSWEAWSMGAGCKDERWPSMYPSIERRLPSIAPRRASGLDPTT
jgi:hypothetical protein